MTNFQPLQLNLKQSLNSQSTAASPASGKQNTEFTGIFGDSLASLESSQTSAGQSRGADPAQANIATGQSKGQGLPLTGPFLPPEALAELAAGVESAPGLGVALEQQLVLPSNGVRFGLQSGETAQDLTLLPTGIAQAIETVAAAHARQTESAVATNPVTTQVVTSTLVDPAVDTTSKSVAAAPVITASLSTTGQLKADGQPLQAAIPQTAATTAVAGQTLNQDSQLDLSQQRQPGLMPEFSARPSDKAPDFERILASSARMQTIRDTAAFANMPAAVDSAARTSVEGLKGSLEIFQMQQPLGRPEWSQELGQRLTLMTRDGMQGATLRLTPANMGTIEVKIAMQNEQANISFLAQHGAVREVIEASLPRLRDMLQEAGVKLEQVNVSSQANTQEQKQHAQSGLDNHGQSSHAHYQDGLDSDEETTVNLQLPAGLSQSAVDYYA